MKLIALPKPEDHYKQDVVELLESLLARAKDGEITAVGVVYENNTDGWASVSSRTPDKRVLGAMLIELGMRSLGLGYQGE